MESDGAIGEDATVGSDGATGGDSDDSWTPTKDACVTPGEYGLCELSNWPDRDYGAQVPSGIDPTQKTPVVLVFHGGGGNATSARTMTCPDGMEDNPACMHQIGEVEGFVTVFPNGTGAALLPNARTFNAGGGAGGYECVSAAACTNDVDDVEYVRDVLDDLNTWINVDEGAVFAIGVSNGGAMVHRVGCELADRIAAIAPVGAGNQYATSDICDPAVPVAVMHTHGTDDPCWTYVESTDACLSANAGLKVGAVPSIEGWASRNGCDPIPTTMDEPDVNTEDGVTTTAIVYNGCGAPVVLMRLNDGGHTFPNGAQYLGPALIGNTSRDWGSERIWQFFLDNRR